MATLKATTFGDPEAKLTVKRSWLKEVHRLLSEGEQAKRDLAALQVKVRQQNQTQMSEDQDMDGVFDETFGEGGVFEKMFGKRRGRR
jgi:hypothetical protein